MTHQPSLIIEDDSQAMADAVRALGGSKIVAAMLWPTRDIVKARQRLDDCLNPNRDERLTLGENLFILRKAREAGYHNAKHWIDEATGYRASEPMEPVDEMARLQRAFIDSVSLQQSIAERMERLGVMPTMQTRKGSR